MGKKAAVKSEVVETEDVLVSGDMSDVMEDFSEGADLLGDPVDDFESMEETPDWVALGVDVPNGFDEDEVDLGLESDSTSDADVAELLNEDLSHLKFTDGEVRADGMNPFDMYCQDMGKIRLLTPEEEIELGKAIREGLYARRVQSLRLSFPGGFLSDADDYGELGKLPMSASDEELRKIISAGRAAEEKLVYHNLRLVISIAKRYGKNEWDLMEAIQWGNLGLMRAVHGYDYTRGMRFSTYATNWIKQSLMRNYTCYHRMIRLPVHTDLMSRKVHAACSEFELAHGREPTDAELAEIFELPEQRIREIKLWNMNPVSLYTPIGDEEDTCLGDFIPATDDLSLEDMTYESERAELIRAALGTLSPKFEHILRARFGMDGRARTLEEVGAMFGCTRERIRQIESKALRQLRSRKVLWGLMR